MTTVSVLMPSYNHGKYVGTALQSIFRQTRLPKEIIVVDDCSTDRSFEVVCALQKESPVPMIVRRNDENRGLCYTLNRCLAEASGDWIALLPSDDLYEARRIELHLPFASAQSGSCKISHGATRAIDAQGDYLEDARVRPHGYGTGNEFWETVRGELDVAAGTLMAETRFLRELGGFDESLRAEDFDIHLRAARQTRFSFFGEPVYYNRVLSKSLGRRTAAWTEDVMTALSKHRDVFGELWPKVAAGRQGRTAVTCLLNRDISGGGRHLCRAMTTKGSGTLPTKLRVLGTSALVLASLPLRPAARHLLQPSQRARLYSRVRPYL